MWLINLENISNLVTHTLTQLWKHLQHEAFPVLPFLPASFCPLLMLLSYASRLP